MLLVKQRRELHGAWPRAKGMVAGPPSHICPCSQLDKLLGKSLTKLVYEVLGTSSNWSLMAETMGVVREATFRSDGCELLGDRFPRKREKRIPLVVTASEAWRSQGVIFCSPIPRSSSS